MSPTVQVFSGQSEEWDDFVRSRQGWTHFHLHGWKDVIEDAFGHRCTYLAARDDTGAVTGVLPLVRVKSLVFGDYLVSMPFLNYGGPLGDDDSVTALVDEAVALADGGSVDLLELRSRFALESVALSPSHRKITVIMDLEPGDPDKVWSGIKAKVRSQARRASKEGVEARFGLDQLDAFYGVFSRHMRDLGTPVLGRRVFRAIAERFPEDVWFGCAYLGDEPIAAGCGFRWGDELEMTWASSLREHNHIAPNMFLYWSFMERATLAGCTLFNFGRCTPGGGTHRFKKQWGGRDEQLWWYQRSKTGAEAATPSPDTGLFALATRAWRRLPVGVTRILGPRIVKNIP